MDFLLHPSIVTENQEGHHASDWFDVFEYVYTQQPMAIDQSYDLIQGYCDGTVRNPTQEECSSYTPDGRICMNYVNYAHADSEGYSQSVYTESFNYTVQYSSHNLNTSYDESYATSDVVTTVPPGKMSTYSELIPNVHIESYCAVETEEEAPQEPVVPSQCDKAAEESPRQHPSTKPSGRKPSSRPKAKGKSKGKNNNTRTSTRVKKQCTEDHSASGSSSTVSPQEDTSGVVLDDETDLALVPFSLEKKKVVKKRKRRDAVSLACYFCRKRKIACNQPPKEAEDKTCGQCSTRDLKCIYPKESRRGLRRKLLSAA